MAGDVVRPGAYPVSAAGTVLNALYAAGGPTTNGSFRRVDVRRGGQLVDSVDVYDYLTRGINPSGVRLQAGDVVFVPVHGGLAKLAGKVKRPAVYELRPNETLRDALRYAGGFDPGAAQARVTIHRMLPPSSRDGSGRARVVIAVGADQFVNGEAPEVPMAPGDSVTVHEVTRPGFGPSPCGETCGWRARWAIRPACGSARRSGSPAAPSPTCIWAASSSPGCVRTPAWSSCAPPSATAPGPLPTTSCWRRKTRSGSSPAPPSGPSATWRWWVRCGSRDGSPIAMGMTVRDAVLLADGLTPDAWLQEAEIARLAEDSTPSALATTIRVPLDSSYLFGRRPGDTYAGPPGLARAGRAARPRPSSSLTTTC